MMKNSKKKLVLGSLPKFQNQDAGLYHGFEKFDPVSYSKRLEIHENHLTKNKSEWIEPPDLIAGSQNLSNHPPP